MADGEKLIDVKDRAFDFAVRIVKLCQFLEKRSEVSRSVCSQLLRAGTSVGANLEEAAAGQSRADFIHKSSIALKEAREANYWLRLILATTDFDVAIRAGVESLEQESAAISKIVGKRIVSTKKSIE